MAEFLPPPPEDPVEGAYRRALLDDESGREARRARLMAALPQPAAAAPVAVAQHVVARRPAPMLLGLLLGLLLLAGVWVLKGRSEATSAGPDPRLAAAPASEPVRVAQADQAAVSRESASARLPAMAAEPPPAPQKPQRPMKPAISAPVVVADATPPVAAQRAETDAAAPVAAPAAAMAPAAPPTVAAAERAPVPVDARAKAQALASQLAAQDRAAWPPEAPPAGLRLLAAASQGDVAGMRAAVQAGASVQVRDTLGRTPLMLAARVGSRDAVSWLLGAGARPQDLDSRGWTAADHARDQGQDAVAELLR